MRHGLSVIVFLLFHRDRPIAEPTYAGYHKLAKKDAGIQHALSGTQNHDPNVRVSNTVLPTRMINLFPYLKTIGLYIVLCLYVSSNIFSQVD
jgi:hypothetical protein